MGIENVKGGKLLYHLTKLSNLDSILDIGLVSRKVVKDNNIGFSDVADQEIISKRSKLGLDEYVPFHFHPYSSFDVAVKSTYAEENFIYICIKRDLARAKEFKILPMHPLSIEECSLLEYDDGFNNIDWKIMQTKGLDDKYARHVKMAECLTGSIVPINLISHIYVKNEQTKKLVEDKLSKRGIKVPPPFVTVQKWF